jgi:hypothetical protein
VRVVVGLNEPQAPTGVQLQVTPAVSFVVAAMLAVAPATIDDGGGVLNETVIPEDRSMVIGLVLVVALVAEVAVMTTVVAGTLLGAV